jgi:glycosyltransferase involved in cell wall biosynthesis
VVLPVYGRAPLVELAVASVQSQSDPHWRLLIADDGSDPATEALLRRLAATDGRIRLVRRPCNLGLFANLNAALAELDTPWLLILCSDDLLEPEALVVLRGLITAHPACDLVLSSYRSIDAAGAFRFDVNGWYTDHFAPTSREFAAGALLPVLLRFGSINGNITGLLIRASLFARTGPWRQDWRQAADWEWLIRAAEQGPLLLNRRPIAAVRTHDNQLSNANRLSGHELPEIAAVVGQLRRHALLRQEPQRDRWAAHLMQFQLWNLLKQVRQGKPDRLLAGLAPIQQGAGLLHTCFALLVWLPERWRRHRRGGRSVPKHLTNSPSP